MEKLPLLAIVAVFCYIALSAQDEAGALADLSRLSLDSRLKNSLVSYLVYIIQAVYPNNLGPFYPFQGNFITAGQAGGAALVLLIITAATIWQRRRAPYLPVGWLWYLGTLVPVIGLVQIGGQSHADRYAYVPLVGLFFAVVWLIVDLAQRWHHKGLLIFPIVTAFAYLMLLSWTQVHYWQNSVALWTQALNAGGESSLVHNNLGKALLELGEEAAAAEEFHAALRADSANGLAHFNLGSLAMQHGQWSEAVQEYEAALRLEPNNLTARCDLGFVLMKQAKFVEAAAQYRMVLRQEPNHAFIHINLGLTLLEQKQFSQAIQEFQEAARLEPQTATTHHSLGWAQYFQGDEPAAVASLRRAVQLQPENAIFHGDLAFILWQRGEKEAARDGYLQAQRADARWSQNLLDWGWTLATNPDPQRRDGQRALRLAQQVHQAMGDADSRTLDVLAAAYAENGRFSEASATGRKAQASAAKAGEAQLAEQIERRLELYEKKKPFRSKTADSANDKR